jgi:hypothetical protein
VERSCWVCRWLYWRWAGGRVGGGQHGWIESGPTSSLDETITPTVVKIRRGNQSSLRRVLLMTREGAKAESKSPKPTATRCPTSPPAMQIVCIGRVA